MLLSNLTFGQDNLLFLDLNVTHTDFTGLNIISFLKLKLKHKSFFLRRRFILHKETNLQKKLHTYFTKSIYTYNGDAIHNIHAGSLRTTSYRSL